MGHDQALTNSDPEPVQDGEIVRSWQDNAVVNAHRFHQLFNAS
jgi:hypothetical protein